jgi:Tol biopolymer transport system component
MAAGSLKSNNEAEATEISETRQAKFDICVRPLAGGAPLRLTSNPANDYSPAWSPDGMTIAFLRRTGASSVDILLIAAAGGSERRLCTIHSSVRPESYSPGPFLVWARNGAWLVVGGLERRKADMFWPGYPWTALFSR